VFNGNESGIGLSEVFERKRLLDVSVDLENVDSEHVGYVKIHSCSFLVDESRIRFDYKNDCLLNTRIKETKRMRDLNKRANYFSGKVNARF
jgi:hypothetical protein